MPSLQLLTLPHLELLGTIVAERLQQISSSLPRGIQPNLGLPATAFGELYQYTLSGPLSPMDLKDLHEWVIKPQLRTLPGVSEINAWGGQTKQFQIVVDPALLAGTVAAKLGVREQRGQSVHDTLLDVLRPCTLLLLLDNCEHLIDACAILANDLLRACAGVRILATSGSQVK